MKQKYNLTDIYNDFYPRIVHYLSRMVGEHSAEDAAQIVFEKINKGLANFKGDAKLSTWIYRIATNTAMDILKSAAHRQSLATISATSPSLDADIETTDPANGGHRISTPDQLLIDDEMNSCIREFVDRLPPDYRTIIILNELKGMTSREIADILEITLHSAKIRLHRARTRLKKELETGCDFYHNERNALACDRKQPRR